MFIRQKPVISKRTGKTSTYYQLVESISTAKGSRLMVLLHIGKLDISEDERSILSSMVDGQIKGRSRQGRFSDKLEQLAQEICFRYAQSKAKEPSKAVSIVSDQEISFLKESLEFGFSRSVGEELLALYFWNALKFDKIFKDCGFTNNQIELSRLAILGRLLSPGSECHTVRWFNRLSSLRELSIELKNGVNKDALYRISDLILENKMQIETQLRRNLKRYHSLVDRVYLYDLTNTYFEGNKLGSELCKRGKSKEKRSDCPLVTLALVVDQDGFPVYSRVYAGNQSEPKTLEDVLLEVQNSHEDLIDQFAQPMVIMDRGIATKSNIALLKEKGYTYFVVSRSDDVRKFKEEFGNISSFNESRDRQNGKLYMKKVAENDLTKVLVYSEAKALKERSMVSVRERKFLEEAEHLIDMNKRASLINQKKICERIGRLKERYGSISGRYDFCLYPEDDKPERIKQIELLDLNKKTTKAEFPGCYVIETNSVGFTSEEIWSFYMKLSEVESAFRYMKTDLGTRPIHHQNDTRVESHLFYSVLAYSILKSIIVKLAQKGIHTSWTQIKEDLRTLQRSSMIFMDTEGNRVNIRQNGTPEEAAKKLFSTLKITVPKNQITTKTRASNLVPKKNH